MFNGVQEQFHQLLSSTRASNNTNSLPQPFSFPPSNSLTYPTFDPFPPPHPHQLLHGRRLTEPVVNQKDEEKEESGFLSKSLLLLEKERLMAESMYPWTNEDVLSRFRIRSNMANCFPDSTWEHVSSGGRKLGEVGFKRNAENCKDKFEEEGRYLDSVNFSKNYRLFGELEELYHGDNQQHQNSLALSQHHHHQKLSQDAADVQNEAAAAEGGRGEDEEEDDNIEQRVEDDSRTDNTEEGQAVDSHEKMVGNHSRARKRKRHSKKFEMFKGFCEIFVNKIMAHQEEMLHKFLEDMMKREEEKIAREEAWKKQEKERMKREMEFREHEQAIAGDRQAKIIEFLKNLTSKITIYDHQNHYHGVGIENSNIEVPIYNSSKSPSIFNYKAITSTRFSSNMGKPHQNPSHDSPNLPSSSNDETQASQNPKSLSTQNDPFAPTSSSLRKHPQNATVTKLNQERSDDTGKRWLRDEVLALINLRCSLYNNGDDQERNNPKGPLWKGISKGMSELGYQRSAKRCKEKWENINKYFRKTKYINKKRSVDSRTCPYFHRLSYLYSQGTLVGTSHTPENCSLSPVNRPALMEPGNCSLHASDHGEDHAVHPTAGYLKIFNSS